MKRLIDFSQRDPSPFAKWELTTCSGHGREGFESSYEGGVLRLQAETPLGAAFGIAQLARAARAGHLAEWLGKRQPFFVLRPVRLRTPVSQWELFCEQLVMLGYNAVVSSDAPLELCHAYGLQVISPQPGMDYLLWESRTQLERSPERAKTESELVMEELRRAEQAAGAARLIFSLPLLNQTVADAQARWLGALCDAASICTTIAFPACGGTHSIWEALRRSPDCSSTPLLPLVDLSSSEELERVFCRMERHPFAGALISAESFVDQALFWVAAQRQWSSRAAPLLECTFRCS